MEGSIEIDGVDICSLPLTTLRSRLGIITQTPVLFSGPLRRSLDPLGRHSDGEMWDALAAVSMREAIAALPDGLDAHVAEGGSSFSAGQRQLLTVARALLQRVRVLVLDEPSSAVDVIADAVLQRTIRTAFAKATVLTIAHRIATIVDSDRILVLGAGRVLEFDAPARLLANPASEFSRMVAEAAAGGEHLPTAGGGSPPQEVA